MAGLNEMATDLGNALARTDEYRELKKAVSRADDDREVVSLRNELEELEERLQGSIRRGEKPDEELLEEYEKKASELQSSSTFQRLAAAQANFDKVVQKVNQTIQRGLQEASESRIVLPS